MKKHAPHATHGQKNPKAVNGVTYRPLCSAGVTNIGMVAGPNEVVDCKRCVTMLANAAAA